MVIPSLFKDLLLTAISQGFSFSMFHDLIFRPLAQFLHFPQAIHEQMCEYVADIRLVAPEFRLPQPEGKVVDIILRGLNSSTRACYILLSSPTSFSELFVAYSRIACMSNPVKPVSLAFPCSTMPCHTSVLLRFVILTTTRCPHYLQAHWTCFGLLPLASPEHTTETVSCS